MLLQLLLVKNKIRIKQEKRKKIKHSKYKRKIKSKESKYYSLGYAWKNNEKETEMFCNTT